MTNARVIAVAPDGSMTLESNGTARFVDVRFPEPKLAESWLAEHVLQQTLMFEVLETDRYGRALISSEVEEKMLRAGVAVYYASQGTIPQQWLLAEAAARTAKIGVWADAQLVVTPENAAQHEQEFHVAEGTVRRIYSGKTATYLNFGADWHSDFSVTIPAKLRRSMQDTLNGIREGSRVRVRGTLYEENGPMILLSHADNLERL